MKLEINRLAVCAICAAVASEGLCGDLRSLDVGSFREMPVAEARRLAAFDNATFDDRSKFGVFSDGRMERGGGLGYNGNAGVKIIPKDKPYKYVFPIKVPLEKNRRYVFSLDICYHGKLDSGTSLGCDSHFKGTKKYAAGYYGTKKVADLEGGWRRVELEIVPKYAPEEVDYTLFVYVVSSRTLTKKEALSPENYLLADNPVLREDSPRWYFTTVWPTHFKVFSDNGNLRSHSAFVGPYLPPDADAVYEHRLVAPDGREIARDVVRALPGGAMTARFGKFAYSGEVDLVTTLCDLKGRARYGSKKIRLTAAPTYRPKKGEIFVQENGIPLVDGKPFMPVGFYADFSYAERYTKEEVEEHLAILREAGVNLIMDYGTYTLKGERQDWYYDACLRNCIRVLNDDFKPSNDKEFEGFAERAPAKIARLKKYPAIIGFYTMDERNEDAVPSLEIVRRILNKDFPGAVVNTCNIHSPAAFLSTADVAGGDKYPIDNRPGSCLAEMDSYCRKLAETTALGWHAPQCYNWANSRRGSMESAKAYRKAGREATENEMLSVALTYASHGIKGFIFYSYFDIGKTAVRHLPLLRWRRIKSVIRHLKSLEPFIMSGEPIVELPHTDVKGRTRLVALSDGKGRKCVLAVGLTRDNECTFDLEGVGEGLKPAYGLAKEENGRWRFKGREFTCDILIAP